MGKSNGYATINSCDINEKINAVRNFVLSVGHRDPGIVRQSVATANSNPRK